jgi:hypothetical protein
MKQGLPTFAELRAHSKFDVQHGLCRNIRTILGADVRDEFSVYLEIRQFHPVFPIGKDSFTLEFESGQEPERLYMDLRDSSGLYCDLQLTLRELLYSNFVGYYNCKYQLGELYND